MINNPMFSLLWGSLLVALMVIPIYIAQGAFGWVERLFAVVTIMWRGGANIVGATIGLT